MPIDVLQSRRADGLFPFIIANVGQHPNGKHFANIVNLCYICKHFACKLTIN